MRLTLGIIFLFSSLSSFAKEDCTLELHEKIIVFNKPTKRDNLNNIIKTNTCSDSVTWSAINRLVEVEGEITAKHLTKLIKEEAKDIRVKIWPNLITVISPSSIINSELRRNTGFIAQNIEVVSPITLVGLNKVSPIRIACHACNTTGMKNTSIDFTIPMNELSKRIWVKFDILKHDLIVVAKKDIRPFTSKNLIEQVELAGRALADSSDYVKNIEDLRYFKLNKVIKVGEAIKHTDLTPRKLVELGKMTSVVVANNGLKIISEAIAKQSGRYGEIITLYNPKSKKQIRAKVIDHNKVKVEL